MYICIYHFVSLTSLEAVAVWDFYSDIGQDKFDSRHQEREVGRREEKETRQEKAMLILVGENWDLGLAQRKWAES